MSVAKITKRSVDQAKVGSGILRDTDVKGFMLITSGNGVKSYAVEYRMRRGRGVPKRRITIGRHGSPWTPELARAKAKQLLADAARGVDPLQIQYGDAATLKLTDLCDIYMREGVGEKKPSTLRGDASRIRHYLKPRLGERPVGSITRADVERLVQSVKAMPFANGKRSIFNHGKRILTGGPGAAAQCLAVLSAIFSFAKEHALLSENPALGIKKPAGRKMERFLSEDEIDALFVALSDEVARTTNPYPSAAIRLLLLTGCRKSEILDLHWRDVDFGNQCLRLRDSKTGAKIIHLNSQALDVLENLPRLRGNPYVIVGCRIDSGRGGLDTTWKRVRMSADLRDVRLHDLRHSFASIAVKSGLSLHIVGQLLGHKTPSTTQRYAHLADETLKRAAQLIGADIEQAAQRSQISEASLEPATRPL